MAGLNETTTLCSEEYRPCVVEGKKALFHRWEDHSSIIPPSPMIGGHAGGVLRGVLGIVEYEDGHIAQVYATSIQFVDNLFAEYAFPEVKPND